MAGELHNDASVDTTCEQENVLFPAPDIGPGWTYRTKIRKRTGQADKYYLTPRQKYSLRSKPQVRRFLEALVEYGDETKAYAAIRKRDKASNSHIKTIATANETCAQKRNEPKSRKRTTQNPSGKTKHHPSDKVVSSKKRRRATNAASSRKSKPKTNTKSVDWWEVEGFRDRRINKETGTEEYLIKWRGYPESSNSWEPSSNLHNLDDAEAWWKEESKRRNRQERMKENLKLLESENRNLTDEFEEQRSTHEQEKEQPSPAQSTNTWLEDETWDWGDAAQIKYRKVQRISVHAPAARDLVTEARINGTPVVLIDHVGWANFAMRWLRRKDNIGNAEKRPQGNENIDRRESGEEYKAKIDENSTRSGAKPNNAVPKEVLREVTMNTIGELGAHMDDGAKQLKAFNDQAFKNSFIAPEKEDTELLDLADPRLFLDIDAMSNDIGDEEVPVVRRNYQESKPISRNILASKFFEVGWNEQDNETSKRRKSTLYLHQWQFPLSETACKKLCHQNKPLPNNILGEDLLKYWLDRVKLDSPLQYLFMGKADTMSKIHRDNGGLAISIAPITGEKECVLVHRDDGHACLYNNQASLDPDHIDLNAYPLLPHARIWRTTIKPGEILLMPHGTYHQCRNVTPCLSYSRFHLDAVNLRAFLQSMMDGDTPELDQDMVLWNSTRELIDIVDNATDTKRKVDADLFNAVDGLRALRNIAKEVTRKLTIRELVKGTNHSSDTVSSSVHIDGDARVWQNLVDDVDVCLHDFRYRFSSKTPTFKPRRSIGKKILALPALPFRGKSKPSETEMTQGGDEPVVAFECPTDRGFLALPKVPTEIFPEERMNVADQLTTIVKGDQITVRILGRKCIARVQAVVENALAALMSFEDLPLLYNDYVPLDLLRIPSVSGSCLVEPTPEEVKPGKILVSLVGKDEYRGVVQHIRHGRFFKARLDFGNGHKVDKLIDSDSILSVTRCAKNEDENRG